jgi:phage gp29-like protein
MPLRLGRYEPGAGADDKEALSEAIKSLGADAAGIISKNTEIQFIESQKQGSADVYRGLTDFCNREMSKAVIGATLTAEVGEHGSYAASKTHENVRQDLVRSDAWALARTLRRQLLRPLVGFNFGWDTPVPWFRFFLEEPEDLKTLSEVYRNLAALGQPISAEHVSERFGVPLPRPGQTGLDREPSRDADSRTNPHKETN